MKMMWVKSNGRQCTVREVSPVVMTVVPNSRFPVKCINEVMSADAARELMRSLLDSGLYEVKKHI